MVLIFVTLVFVLEFFAGEFSGVGLSATRLIADLFERPLGILKSGISFSSISVNEL